MNRSRSTNPHVSQTVWDNRTKIWSPPHLVVLYARGTDGKKPPLPFEIVTESRGPS